MKRPFAELAGTGSYAPKRVVTNDDFSKILDTSDEWIRERTGIRERHIASDAETNAAMGKCAAEVVLRDKAEWREKARAQLVEWFAACPDAEAVSRGRRYLGMYLN